MMAVTAGSALPIDSGVRPAAGPAAALAPQRLDCLRWPMGRGSYVEVRDLDPERSSRLVGLATAGVLAYGANLLVAALLRVAAGPIGRGHLAQAAVATALVLGPAVWLMWAAAHNTGARARTVVLSAVAVLVLAGLPVIGSDWLGSLTTLAALVLIAVRPPWSLLLFAVLAVAPWPLSVAFGHPEWAGYFCFVVVLHGPPLAVLVWLVAKTRQLQAARLELAERAVVRERLRIDDELRGTLGAALGEIVARGEYAGDLAVRDAPAAGQALAAVVEDARRTLARARLLVRQYQTVTLRAEVEAAAALLSAAGIATRIVLPPEEPPPGALEPLRAQLRAQTARLLTDDKTGHCLIRVDRRDGRFELDIDSGVATAPPARGVTG
jgi:signal transduction histidine kinase